jgi:hypothetical protein
LKGWLRKWAISDIKALRFAFGMTLATTLAFSIAWPISFLTALLVGKILSTDKPYLSLQEGTGLLVIITISMLGGLVVALTLINYPVAFVSVITLALLMTYYLGTRGAPAVLIIMMLVGFTVIPMLGLQSMVLAYEAVKALVFAAAVSLVIAWIAYAIVPGGELITETKNNKQPGDFTSAIKSTIVVIPLFLFIYLTNKADAILVLIFVSILSQNTEYETGVKSGVGLIIGNLIGGVIGIAIYTALVAVPSLAFFVLIMTVVWLFISRFVFEKTVKGVLFGFAMSTIIVVLSGALSFTSTEALSTVYVRIIQLMLVAVYIAMFFSIIDSLMVLFNKKRMQDVQVIH